MKFQVNDLVRKDDGEEETYKIVATRTFEPCCLLQRQSNVAEKQWAITEELRLVSEESPRSETGHSIAR